MSIGALMQFRNNGAWLGGHPARRRHIPVRCRGVAPVGTVPALERVHRRRQVSRHRGKPDAVLSRVGPVHQFGLTAFSVRALAVGFLLLRGARASRPEG